MKWTRSSVILGMGIVLSAIPAFSHHSFVAEYDAQKPIKVSGTITKVEMVNPHGWIYIEVKSPEGKIENWGCETAAPNALIRRGWKKDSLKVGDVIDVDGYRAKDGSTTLNARSVTFPDGRSVFAPPPDDSGTQK